MIKDENVLDKYNRIWNKIKEKLGINFHSMPVYDETYIRAKVREFDGKIKTNLLDDEIPNYFSLFWYKQNSMISPT